METIAITQARKNIYQLIQDVNTTSSPITITNAKGKNAVLIAENDWHAIEESLYLNSIPGMADSILAGGCTPLGDCLGEDEVSFDV